MTSIAENPVVYIATGLVVLICGQLWPQLPVVSAAAMIACGACSVALKRQPYKQRAVVPLMLVLHLFVYTSLIALFLGARLHGASVGDAPLGPIDLLDFSVAGWFMVVAFGKTIGSVLQCSDVR